MKRIKLIILQNEQRNDHHRWVAACGTYSDQLNLEVVDLTKNSWLDRIVKFQPDLLLTKPGGLTAPFKQLYDERLTILVKELGFQCFPSLDEVLIYENKRYFSYWLRAHKIPHPETNVFYFRDEAISFLNNAEFPIVGKVNIGASGSGVTILNNTSQAEEYILHTFSGKGAAKRTGPNVKKGGLVKRGFHYLFHPRQIFEKLAIYRARAADAQTGFVILQEFIPHEFEWRVVRIGDSFFAHKKLKMGEKASGSLMKSYDNPPLAILDFARDITDRFGFFSQAVDIFETDKGFLVNEMQCIFGQSDPYQMLVDGKPGRYLCINSKWVFDEGDFNTNQSYDLRIRTAIEMVTNTTR